MTTEAVDYSKIDKNSTPNQYANFWRYHIGVNVIPSKIITEIKKDKDGKMIEEKKRMPIVSWKDYQTTPIPEWQHNQWLRENKFKDGMSVICGRVWHRSDLIDYYLAGFDSDNTIATNEYLLMFGNKDDKPITIEEFAQRTLVDQHSDNLDKFHWYAYTIGATLQDKTSDIGHEGMNENTMPAFEVKASSKFLMHCAPGPHKNGQRIEIKGTVRPFAFNNGQVPELQDKLNRINEKYGLYTGSNTNDNKIPIEELFKPGNPTLAGHNRHERVLKMIEALLVRTRTILPLEQIKKVAKEFNDSIEYFNPPLDEYEFEKQWDCGLKFIEEKGYVINDGLDEHINHQQSDGIKEMKLEINPLEELDPYIEDKDYFENIVRTVKRRVKCEDSLIRQIGYVILSKDTVNPLNLARLCPTSEGKTYAIKETIRYAPDKQIWKIGSMSPKVLIRDKGVLVNGETLEPIDPELRAIKKELMKLEQSEKKDFDEIEALEARRNYLLANSKRLIDLTGLVIVFLEPPHPDTWDILKPILSHDQWVIEHPYVDKIGGKGMQTIKIITRGWPSCIFCSAKNESNWPGWPEIQSRFLITSTNMIQQKYAEGNLLTSQVFGLPKSVQKRLIVSDEQEALTRKCFKYLIQEIQKKSNFETWIPYWSYLFESLPAEKGTDNRLATRVFHLLSIIAQCRSHLRCKLQDGENNIMTIPDIEHDLREVIYLIKNVTGIPTFKLKMFKKYSYHYTRPIKRNGIIV